MVRKSILSRRRIKKELAPTPSDEAGSQPAQSLDERQAAIERATANVEESSAKPVPPDQLEPVHPKQFRELLRRERERFRFHKPKANPAESESSSEENIPHSTEKSHSPQENGASPSGPHPNLSDEAKPSLADSDTSKTSTRPLSPQSNRASEEEFNPSGEVEADRAKEDQAKTSQAKASESSPRRRLIPSPGQTREEVLTKIRDGFSGLNNVLSDIGNKLEVHNNRSHEIARSVETIPELMKDLPETSRNGVELLQSISTALEGQTSVTREMVQRIEGLADQIRKLPEAFDGMSRRLDRQDAATQRLDQSMTHVREAVVAMQVESARIHRETLEEFRQSQEADREQVQRTLERDRDLLKSMVDRTNRQGQFMMFLTVILILAFLAALSKL